MTKPIFTLAYSPCPNDTFLFYHLTHSDLSPEFSVQEELKDVEELNHSAIQGKYDITKLSFAAYFRVANKYDLLEAGSALGRNCGPILIYPESLDASLSGSKNSSVSETEETKVPGKPEKKNEMEHFKKLLSPGENTTANLLWKLFLEDYIHKNKIPEPSFFDSPSSKEKNPPSLPELSYHRYDRIIPMLQKGEGDLGLVIHEERFTYESQGMKKWLDLGEWWEKTTGTPIPLGCIAIRKDLSQEWKERMNQAIQKSLELAWERPSIPQEYILQNSQNKDLDVVKSHIDLYVNRFTHSLGEEGKRAIQELQTRYKKALVSRQHKPMFF